MTTVVRASSLPGLFDCASRFEAIQFRGLRSPSSGRSVLGRAVHASTAVYDLARLRGDYALTAADAAGAAVDVIHQTEAEAREKACCRDAAPGPNGRWKILPTNYGMSALKDNRQ